MSWGKNPIEITISAAIGVILKQYYNKTRPYCLELPLQKMFPYTLIRYDSERDEPVRDVNGLCVESPRGKEMLTTWHCLIFALSVLLSHESYLIHMWNTHFPVLQGETGLLVSKVTGISPFVGYAQNEEQTEKKRLRNVLKKGDLYFNSGDLMRIDSDNFIYFQDRVGDTFRYITDVKVWQDRQTNHSCPSISARKDAKIKLNIPKMLF